MDWQSLLGFLIFAGIVGLLVWYKRGKKDSAKPKSGGGPGEQGEGP